MPRYEPLPCRHHWHVSVCGYELAYGAFATRDACQQRCNELNAEAPMDAVTYQRLHPDAQVPTRSTPGAAGFDVASVESVLLFPGERRGIRTGLAIAVPEGYECQVRPRSGLALKHGLTVLNTPGTIDSDYRGEVLVILMNHTEVPFQITPGTRIAQLVFAKVETPDFQEVEALPSTARGAGGFGHTGT